MCICWRVWGGWLLCFSWTSSSSRADISDFFGHMGTHCRSSTQKTLRFHIVSVSLASGVTRDSGFKGRMLSSLTSDRIGWWSGERSGTLGPNPLPQGIPVMRFRLPNRLSILCEFMGQLRYSIDGAARSQS